MWTTLLFFSFLNNCSMTTPINNKRSKIRYSHRYKIKSTNKNSLFILDFEIWPNKSITDYLFLIIHLISLFFFLFISILLMKFIIFFNFLQLKRYLFSFSISFQIKKKKHLYNYAVYFIMIPKILECIIRSEMNICIHKNYSNSLSNLDSIWKSSYFEFITKQKTKIDLTVWQEKRHFTLL